jgi:tetratricopeptide (TPR) repeat protein
MRSLLLALLIIGTVAVCAQNSSEPNSASPKAKQSSQSTPARNPSLAPPRSDRVDASTLPDDGQSSSKSTQIDLSPPADDAKAHPKSSEILVDEGSAEAADTHPWDPHKAAKDIEVGDFYFKKKNYAAAESRYREALYYKDNDAIAVYHLALCLEKLDRPGEAREQYESYLTILPHGPEAENAKKAIERLKTGAEKAAK